VTVSGPVAVRAPGDGKPSSRVTILIGDAACAQGRSREVGRSATRMRHLLDW
jgi:hypothetical protein